MSMNIFDPCDSCPKGPYSSFYCSEQCEFGVAKKTVEMQKGMLEKYARLYGGEKVVQKDAYTAAIKDLQEALDNEFHELRIATVIWAIEALKRKVEQKKALSIEQLRQLSEKASKFDDSQCDMWVWIELLNKLEARPGMGKVSGYYKVQTDYTHGRSFCCGYPGVGYGFDYDQYGKDWLAYFVRPEGAQNGKNSSDKAN